MIKNKDNKFYQNDLLKINIEWINNDRKKRLEKKEFKNWIKIRKLLKLIDKEDFIEEKK
ncbi:hypothetical protein HYD82_01010 [Mycoplasmopsis bovis]|nr:hypothetical protein [Mycoplasmopsis bovis]QQH37502.1 hypothetical protein HYD82_01010 [Mycoplasmopsis bovis]